jgi:selenocysteine lyase/cysteine desulfurase
MTMDVEKARAETPGAGRVLHFNNAGAALMPRPVIDAFVDHIRLESEMGGYEAQAARKEAVEGTYRAIARLINGKPDEVALLENATRAWDMAFYGLAAAFKPGDRVLVSEAEYASNAIAMLQVARRSGVSIETVPSDPSGAVSVDALTGMLDARVRLIAITHVPTNGGLVNPAAEIGAVARAAGVPFLLDACQSVGQMPIDVRAIGCDMLSATGRKYLRGPRGTGFLWIRGDLAPCIEPPFLDLHAATWTARDRFEIRPDARRFETFEGNVAGRIALGVAIDHALGWGMEAICARVRGLARSLRDGLSAIPGVEIRDLGTDRCGIVTFTAAGGTPEEIQAALAKRTIHASVSPRAYTLMDMDKRGLASVVRASPHYYNTEDEVERFCAAVEDAL